MEEVYRQAASILLLRPAAEYGYALLLLHKPRKRDAWQLPQGGVEAGETVEQAALRELGEEASIHTAQVLGRSREVYQYDFPASYRRFRPDHVKGQQIAFVLALAPRDTVVTVDGREVDQCAWIDPRTLRRYVKRPAYLSLVRRLLDEVRPLLP